MRGEGRELIFMLHVVERFVVVVVERFLLVFALRENCCGEMAASHPA